ncbi:A24 family peptidase [Humisphaera borealis]|uniref:Prepilin peptidase n=1 Tax=Humisphaera borealis TaxID=2807512 RepID=A0A7M2WUY4_9BACT|nr:A24 family peptidase [Humisphaera borealis]QOV89266.1 prepilin peptidase [Humisphaera borealis]
MPFLPYAPLLALLVWAAIVDVRHRLIRNWLTASLVIGGLMQSCFAGGTISPWQSLLGILTAFALLILPFALGAVGGGDLKLMAGIAAWVGPVPVIAIFLAEKVIGLGIVLVQASAAGRLRELFRNSAVLAVNIAHVNSLGVEHTQETGRQFRSIDRPLPYAVPTLVATAMYLLYTVGGLKL